MAEPPPLTVRMSVEMEDAFRTELDALREATRKAHEVLADIAEQRRALTRTLIDARALKAELAKIVADHARELMETEVEKQVSIMTEATQKAMRIAVEKIDTEFNRLARAYTHGSGGPSLEMQAEQKKLRETLRRKGLL